MLIMKEFFGEALNSLNPKMLEQVAYCLKPELPDAKLHCNSYSYAQFEIVLEAKNDIICAVFRLQINNDAQKIEIKRLWVQPCLRRRGIGKAILRIIEEASRKANYHFLFVTPGGYDISKNEGIEYLYSFFRSSDEKENVTNNDRISIYKSCGFDILDGHDEYNVRMFKRVCETENGSLRHAKNKNKSHYHGTRSRLLPVPCFLLFHFFALPYPSLSAFPVEKRCNGMGKNMIAT